MTLLSAIAFTLILSLICLLLGGIPLISWITSGLTGRKLEEIGTGNISVSAAFYHGGRMVGILAVCSEAFKGIAAVLLARYFFPTVPAFELMALIILVIGRYWMGKGAGTTNVVWGFVVHDIQAVLLIFLIGGIGFTIFRDRTSGRIGILILFPFVLALLHPKDLARIAMAICLGLLMAWIYRQIPDDLDLSPQSAEVESQSMFRFFRGDKAIICLDDALDPDKFGQKAATLSQLKRWGYPVPTGWVLPPGDDAGPLIEYLPISESEPLIVRSSAIGEDSESSSAAGQYLSILNVNNPSELQAAIIQVLASYNQASATQYRQDFTSSNSDGGAELSDRAMAVLIQKQIKGVFSGVAFSRDPIFQPGDAVIIEGLPGDATRVVSGKFTPEEYKVYLRLEERGEKWERKIRSKDNRRKNIVEIEEIKNPPSLSTPTHQSPFPIVQIEGSGNLPPALLEKVAILAREIEDRYHGIPQDIEWSYDGEELWLLQSRPITTLQPIWTRKIAAEVIPGFIRNLTWSINRPLTCGVWGEIFTLVLGKEVNEIDFNDMATLHYSCAYFNATILNAIFQRMGLPPESLEFLTRGTKFTKPPLSSTLQNIPGLIRLLGKEWNLDTEFALDDEKIFSIAIKELKNQNPSELPPEAILQRIEIILKTLKRATYYSIMAPLSMSLRQTLLKVKDKELDNSQTPEIASLRSLSRLAANAQHFLNLKNIAAENSAVLFTTIAENPDGDAILQQFNQFLEEYGYLSEVATDIAIPRWKEDPQSVRQLFTQFICQPPPTPTPLKHQRWQAEVVQTRLNLKGKVTEIYSQLLAQLRWSFVALETNWRESGMLSQAGDIFFLEFGEIQKLVADTDRRLKAELPQIIEQRRIKLEEHRQLTNIPPLVYGNPPATSFTTPTQLETSGRRLEGIGASSGQIEGWIKILTNLQVIPEIDRQTILVVPYTDSGWAPLLAQAGGLIAEVGGKLSHGAIVAREYGIPAVMDVHNATQLLRNNQRVWLDGQLGIIEILD
ncbi:MAG TPA: pyruvate phosphate dikinase PEP/pyruvate-binding protein [Cyanobacteria bacterium UBA11149]|nr:pyruvate phosphate dikinase PEP/pyruvate-binding protein [Cyanobacteria bacterium UBA11367]HBE58517.1 pyruvate phosphate dikinase PEP/pyruvate-binding protein [Cyanobacteria bacterium UBA11366]HBK65323.1 pyruvate phosphate dikinase PEP/pyruvate-binding protein [Cyanobacteria bacterium UBA11166]HBR72444.1 pyruvate phosphate dikinase PEP/pyruvate-binding protein [Cyanobacteria bacterium UBA11159]HBS69459.1 pyruvate phosphate dikinase PEP/pyruvate-binding protein [Cyanobacteria bacterium UBA111